MSDCFQGRRTRQLYRTAIPGPDKLERERMRQQARLEESSACTVTKVPFQSALDLAREQAQSDASVATELATHCRTFGPRSAASNDSCQSLSPRASPQTQARQEHDRRGDFSDTDSSSQSHPHQIPNPPIPGPAALPIEALQSQVNDFARQNGFGVVRRNGSGSSVRKTRYVFECDRYGQPRPSRGTGLCQKRSRKCGCSWKIVGEALEQNNYMWTLREFADPKHSKHNHGRSMSLGAHAIHRRLTDSVKATVEAHEPACRDTSTRYTGYYQRQTPRHGLYAEGCI